MVAPQLCYQSYDLHADSVAEFEFAKDQANTYVTLVYFIESNDSTESEWNFFVFLLNESSKYVNAIS